MTYQPPIEINEPHPRDFCSKCETRAKWFQWDWVANGWRSACCNAPSKHESSVTLGEKE